MFILTEAVIRMVITAAKQFVLDRGHEELNSAILQNFYSLPGLIFSLLDAFTLILANLFILFMIKTIVLYKLDLKNRYIQLIHVHRTVIL